VVLGVHRLLLSVGRQDVLRAATGDGADAAAETFSWSEIAVRVGNAVAVYLHARVRSEERDGAR
jgi:hypothetical protein